MWRTLPPAAPEAQLGLPIPTVQQDSPLACTNLSWFNFGNHKCHSMKVEMKEKKNRQERLGEDI